MANSNRRSSANSCPRERKFSLKLYSCSSKAERLLSVQVTTGAGLGDAGDGTGRTCTLDVVILSIGAVGARDHTSAGSGNAAEPSIYAAASEIRSADSKLSTHRRKIPHPALAGFRMTAPKMIFRTPPSCSRTRSPGSLHESAQRGRARLFQDRGPCG